MSTGQSQPYQSWHLEVLECPESINCLLRQELSSSKHRETSALELPGNHEVELLFRAVLQVRNAAWHANVSRRPSPLLHCAIPFVHRGSKLFNMLYVSFRYHRHVVRVLDGHLGVPLVLLIWIADSWLLRRIMTSYSTSSIDMMCHHVSLQQLKASTKN
jgi:hypothetical protein